MARSRASKDAMRDGGDKWIQKAVNPSTKGALHRALGVPEDKKIPEKKLEKAEHSKDPLTKKRAVFAETLKMFKRK